MPKPTDYQPILGKTAAGVFDKTILEIGGETYTRWEITSKLKCPVSTTAIRRLSRTLAAVGAKTEKAVRALHIEALIRVRGLGPMTVLPLLQWLDLHGVDVDKWYGHNVTVTTVKHQILKKRKDRDTSAN